MINSTDFVKDNFIAEAKHFFTLFLGFGRFSGWFSYKCFSYKKNVYPKEMTENHVMGQKKCQSYVERRGFKIYPV